ncbi:ATP-binding protein [Massilia pinisoli]|uniref:histidine kinase n=1 Tax=Massilia pinisoli TaxID=1772194 RepID=A0ABT1ZPA9_9BURK|nr:ATP-binding protein [Massilia pinisoli]MCS0581744.1 ATP-binding protein [Massilia pinisoli]
MNLSLSRPTALSYYVVIALLLATPALLLWQHFGMIRTIEISPRQPHGVMVADDRRELHGNSVGSVVVRPDAIVMHCELRARASYPFCKLQFLLGEPGKGVDLSRFDTIEFDLRYTGRTPPIVNLNLLNFEPEFFRPGEWNSQRYNIAEIELPAQPRFSIPMNVLRTADWWRTLYKVPLSKTYPRLDHVTVAEISTAAIPPGQSITIELRSLRFRGKWISKTALLAGLVIAWIASGLVGLAQGLLHYRAGLSASNSRLEHLATVDRERKAAEAAREEALAEAVGLARQRSNFLAQMSHELRTPLNAIIGYAQLLRRDRHQLNERQAVGLATIHESGQHLLTLINDILDLARVEAGKMVLHPIAIHLGTFLQVVVDIMRVKAEEKGLAFHYEPAPDLPAAVTVDETRLRQVLLNLLGNAVKFTDQGTVSLRVLPAPPGDGANGHGSDAIARLRFEVADSGIGMSAPQVGRLFHPFEQVADARRREGGTGLGLAISQQLVRLMGGTITVASQPGKGSTFAFELALPVATGTPATQPSMRAIVGYEGERKRVLVVDDVPQNRAMVMSLLQDLGFVVAAAENGMECLVVLDSFKPDLIVMDVMMPVLDGNETTRRIRQLPAWKTIPIIAVAASAGRDDEARSVDAGVDAFLAKPVEHDVLLRTIGTQLALTWIAGLPAPEPHAAEDEDDAALVVPPAQEIEVLWQLARIGNMRKIRERASYLQALDPAYAPFANRLHALAQGYHSKDLAAFVERYRTESAVPPA